MRWIPGGTSGDIEDRRGEGGVSFGGLGGRGLGIGGTLLLLAVSVLFRQNLFKVFSPSPSTVCIFCSRRRPAYMGKIAT